MRNLFEHVHLKCRIALVLLLAFFLFTNQAMSQSNDWVEKCLDEQLPGQPQNCLKAAQSISSNVDILNMLGQKLEGQMNYESAVIVYETGSQKTPHDKSLLQNLVRSRAAWRKQKNTSNEIIASIENLPGRSPAKFQFEACYKQRYQTALAACQTALLEKPQDAGLHERTGDILKSMGRIALAADAYKSSLQISAENPKLVKKLAALTQYSSTQQLSEENKTIKKYQTDNDSPNYDLQANSIAKKQVDLLDRLYKQKLITADEYEYEKQAVLSQFDSLQKSYKTHTGADTDHTLRKLSSLKRGNYHALVIGNNNYSSANLVDLETAVNDAKKIASILKDKYGFKTQLLLDADRYTIMNAISSLRRTLTQSDKLLIYYAGHGNLDQATGQGYWLPVDAESDSIANWVSANDVIDVLTGINAHHAMVIADSCFSATLIRDVGFSNLDERNALLVRLSENRSRTVMTSGGVEPVQDDGGGKHSIFAAALIELLEDNSAVLEAGRLFIKLRNKVIVNADQTPQYAPIHKAGHEGGDFIFIPI